MSWFDQFCYGSVFVRRVNGLTWFAVVAMGAAMLGGGAACAQTADPAAQATPAAHAPAAPVAPAATAPTVAAAPQGGSIKGTVNASGVPLPGVAVTATNTLTGKKYATTTDPCQKSP